MHSCSTSVVASTQALLIPRQSPGDQRGRGQCSPYTSPVSSQQHFRERRHSIVISPLCLGTKIQLNTEKPSASSGMMCPTHLSLCSFSAPMENTGRQATSPHNAIYLFLCGQHSQGPLPYTLQQNAIQGTFIQHGNHRITESQNSRGWKGPLWVI